MSIFLKGICRGSMQLFPSHVEKNPDLPYSASSLFYESHSTVLLTLGHQMCESFPFKQQANLRQQLSFLQYNSVPMLPTPTTDASCKCRLSLVLLTDWL